MSKHEKGTVTKQTTGARGGQSGGVFPSGAAAESKHETGTLGGEERRATLPEEL